MAEPLTAERGHNGPDRASFLGFVTRHDDIEEELTEAQETVRSIRRRRKDLRKLVVAEGHNLEAFDRAMVDRKRSGEEREAEDRAYRQAMMWLLKPVGYQANAFVDTEEGAEAAAEHHLAEAGRDGFAAGKGGHSASLNSFTPGTELFAAWQSGWVRGQESIAETLQPEVPKRGRGRPRKAKDADAEPAPTKNGADPAPPNAEARRLGYENGVAGNQDNAARFKSGEAHHADYELGRAEGAREREERNAESDLAEPAPAGSELLH